MTQEVDLFYLRKNSQQVTLHSEQFLWAADRFINHYVADEQLRELLAYMNPMYGGVAGHTPTYIHALINVLYINGASRFNDGSQQLAEQLVDVIENAGGRVYAGDGVEKIQVDDRLVNHVVTKKGKITVPIIIFRTCTLARCLG